jgi:hypothetical protein
MMNFLKKYAHLYDKIDYQPDIEAVSGTKTDIARHFNLRRAGNF